MAKVGCPVGQIRIKGKCVIDKKQGRYDLVVGKKCYWISVDNSIKFVGSDKKFAIDEGIKAANKEKIGVLILKDAGVIRYTTAKNFEKIKVSKRKR